MSDMIVINAPPWLIDQHVVTAAGVFLGMLKLVPRALRDNPATMVE